MNQFLLLGNSKAIKFQCIEGVDVYSNEVTVYTAHNRYTIYYQNREIAQKEYAAILKKIEERG